MKKILFAILVVLIASVAGALGKTMFKGIRSANDDVVIIGSADIGINRTE